MNLNRLALVCALSSALAACGGGGSDTAPSPTASLSGTVIDGYIEGAKVCLDLNVNQACDPNEPSAESKGDGTYSLDISGLTTAQIRAAHLFTIVPATAKDKDDGGKTLEQAGKAPFDLMAPAGAFLSDDGKTIKPAVISPLTTLVSHDMIAGNGKSLDDAEKSVRTRMNLRVDADLKQDFIANKDTTMIRQVQVLAAAIGAVKKAAKDSGASERDALFAALNYVQQNVAALQTAATVATPDTKVLEIVKTALFSPELKLDTRSLIDDAQKITASSPADIVEILGAGFYDGDCLFKTDCGTPRYFKIYGGDGKWQSNDYTLSGGQWNKVLTPSFNDSEHRLTANGWATTTNGDSGSYTSDGKGGGTATGIDGKTFRLSARMVELGGKTAGSIAGLSVPSIAKDLVFAPGSKLFWVQTSSMNDEYRLYTGYQLAESNCTSGTSCSETKLTNIGDFISTHATDARRYTGWSHVTFTFDAGGNGTGGTVTLWNDGVTTCTPSGCTHGTAVPTYTKTGSAPYEIKTVSGQQILIVKGQARESRQGDYVMFASKDGKLHGGSYQPAGSSGSSDFSFNKAAMNSIMSAAGKPAVLD